MEREKERESEMEGEERGSAGEEGVGKIKEEPETQE